MPATSGKEPGPNKTVIVVVALVLALAAAAFSITRTVTAGQGRSIGTLGGIVGKAEAMKGAQPGGPQDAPKGGDPLSGAPPGQPGE
jgi:hypothetical protein